MKSIWFYTDGCNEADGTEDGIVASGAAGMELPSTKVINHYIMNKYPNDGSNNIKGEIMAVTATLTWCKSNKYDTVIIVTDLQGIPKWANGEWKRNRSITQKLYDCVYSLRQEGMDIRFVWIKGHEKDHKHAYGNDLADKLAGRALGKYKKEIRFMGPDNKEVILEALK